MKNFILFSLGIFVNTITFAQKFSASLDLQMSFPQGEYKIADPDAGIGGRGKFFLQTW